MPGISKDHIKLAYFFLTVLIFQIFVCACCSDPIYNNIFLGMESYYTHLRNAGHEEYAKLVEGIENDPDSHVYSNVDEAMEKMQQERLLLSYFYCHFTAILRTQQGCGCCVQDQLPQLAEGEPFPPAEDIQVREGDSIFLRKLEHNY